jgi:hypothetical protein
MTMAQNGSETGSTAREAVMAKARTIAGDPPTPRLRSIVCPFCGSVTSDTGRCTECSGRFDPLSRQATQNQMGPWEVRDERVPFRPGCSYATLTGLIDQGKIVGETVIRGPSTRQFWMLAKHTPGIGHRFGNCHNCHAQVEKDAFSCPQCSVSFEAERDRQHLGLGPARPLPGQGLPEVLALHAEPASTSTGDRVASTNPGGVSAVAGQPTKRQVIAEGVDETRRRLDDSLRLVEQWRTRAAADRQHAWAVIVLSAIITLGALGYVFWGATGNPSEPDSENASNHAVVSE